MILNFLVLSLFFYQAVLNPIRHDATCYPGIVCDGTETTFFGCKYDRTQISTNISSLFAIITRCIGKIISCSKISIKSSTVSVDGGFSSWSEWSNCTKPCDTGETTRFRTCTEPSPSIIEPETKSTDSSLAGMNCTGEYTQVKSCNKQKC